MKKKNIIKKLISLFVVVSLSLCLFGCGGLKITEDESRQIAEYAAGLLLKYDRNYSGAIQDVTLPQEVSVVNEPEEEFEEIVEEPVPDNPDNNDANIPDEAQNDSKDEIEYTDIPLAQFIEVSGFDIASTGYELSDEYPYDNDNDLYFSTQAQPGNKLLVVHFNVTNNSGADEKLNLVNKNVKYKIIINGTEVIPNSKSILLNDLEQYLEIVNAGTTADTVLIFEISDEIAGSIGTLDLNVKFNDEKVNYKIL